MRSGVLARLPAPHSHRNMHPRSECRDIARPLNCWCRDAGCSLLAEAITYLEGVLGVTKKYAEGRLVWVDKAEKLTALRLPKSGPPPHGGEERKMPLADLPYMAKGLESVEAVASAESRMLAVKVCKSFVLAGWPDGPQGDECSSVLVFAMSQSFVVAFHHSPTIAKDQGSSPLERQNGPLNFMSAHGVLLAGWHGLARQLSSLVLVRHSYCSCKVILPRRGFLKARSQNPTPQTLHPRTQIAKLQALSP